MWHPRQEGRQIRALSTDDMDNQKLIQQNGNCHEPRIELAAEQAQLLLSRNSHLSKFIT